MWMWFCKVTPVIHDRFGVKNPKVQIIYTMAGRKQKKQKQIRNISGLRNQAKASPAPSASSQHPTPPRSRAPSPEDDGDESDLEEDDEDLDENDEGEEYMEDWQGFDSLEMSNAMGKLIKEDDPDDLGWMPPKMRKELERRERLKTSQYSLWMSLMSTLTDRMQRGPLLE